MPRAKTPSFITEIEIATSPSDRRILDVRLDCARQVYNACLGETLKRLDRLVKSENYLAAKKMSRTVKGEPNKERSKAFHAARKAHSFDEYALNTFAAQFNRSWLGEHLGIVVIQQVATRAFKAAEVYLLGIRGRPRFKGKGRMRSLEGNGGEVKATPDVFRQKEIYLCGDRIEWRTLSLKLIVKPGDVIHQHGLTFPVKYIRLVRKVIRGKVRWFAQLINQGQSFVKPKNKVGTATIGVDIGPSTIAIVSTQAGQAKLAVFCNEISDKDKKIRRYQRHMARSDRVNNPGNFEPDRWVEKDKHWVHKKGKVKKGRHSWVNSNARKLAQSRKAELERKLTAHRKCLHGKMVNDILTMGPDVNAEKLSYVAFQKRFGKSIGKRAPGMFMEHLRRKAVRAGGGVNEFPTRTTRLSQLCHGCGSLVKKPLSERWHNCSCGVVGQRDLYSAFLAECVEGNGFNADLTHKRWVQAKPLLQAALSQLESSNTKHLPSSLGLRKRPGTETIVCATSGTIKTEAWVQLELPFVA